MTVSFETTSTVEDAFNFYENWCSERGGYIKQPYESVDMLISPIHDLKKAVVIIVANGATLEDGEKIANPVVVITIQGGDIYNSVSNLK
jgi:hypothetical protein